MRCDPHSLIGQPYQRGAAQLGAGFDCWTLVEYVRRECYALPTPAAALEAADACSPRNAVRAIRKAREAGGWTVVARPGAPGDVVGMAFAKRAPLHHVGIALADGVLHAWQGVTPGGRGSVILTPWARLSQFCAIAQVFAWRA